eukprot:5038906-Pyramimonas_sp.AAC.1
MQQAFPVRATFRGTTPRQNWIQADTLEAVDHRTLSMRTVRQLRVLLMRATRALCFLMWAQFTHDGRHMDMYFFGTTITGTPPSPTPL